MASLVLCLVLILCTPASAATAAATRRLQQFTSLSSLERAFIALQAWKLKITSDPLGITDTWVGADVCSYRGVFCSAPPAPLCYEESIAVTGIDLNHAQLGGELAAELGLLNALALFHINTNSFCGTVPSTFAALTLLYELDLSNNRFEGPFPYVVLAMPSLAYLDLRYNQFSGKLPAKLFECRFDAILVNNNNFDGELPWNLGGTPASLVNLANNRFTGVIPASIGNVPNLDEILFLNNSFQGCIPDTVRLASSLRVFDVSSNLLAGTLPKSLVTLKSVEQLNVASNVLSGDIPAELCKLASLLNFTVYDNFFSSEGVDCPSSFIPRGATFDDRANCIQGRPLQRPPAQCKAVQLQPVSCFTQRPPVELFGVAGSVAAAALAPSPFHY